MSNRTIQCHSCGVSLHVGDLHSEDGCPVCGGEIHTQEHVERRAEFKELLSSKPEDKF